MVTYPAPVKPILLVEDQTDISDLLVCELEADGYVVAVASDGPSALELLRAGLDPCLILLDARMPGGDGADFRREQLEDPQIARIPTIAYSGDGEMRETMESLGVTHFFLKPLPTRTLLDLIEHHRSRD